MEIENTLVQQCIAYRHRLLNILINLFNNAQEALAPLSQPDKRVVVRTLQLQDGRVAVEVLDNGPGIALANQVRMFSYGVTTRADGHGFGQHASSNDARVLGGSLTVHSEGQGRGARFTIEFPMRIEDSSTKKAA